MTRTKKQRKLDDGRAAAAALAGISWVYDKTPPFPSWCCVYEGPIHGDVFPNNGGRWSARCHGAEAGDDYPSREAAMQEVERRVLEFDKGEQK